MQRARGSVAQRTRRHNQRAIGADGGAVGERTRSSQGQCTAANDRAGVIEASQHRVDRCARDGGARGIRGHGASVDRQPARGADRAVVGEAGREVQRQIARGLERAGVGQATHGDRSISGGIGRGYEQSGVGQSVGGRDSPGRLDGPVIAQSGRLNRQRTGGEQAPASGVGKRLTTAAAAIGQRQVALRNDCAAVGGCAAELKRDSSGIGGDRARIVEACPGADCHRAVVADHRAIACTADETRSIERQRTRAGYRVAAQIEIACTRSQREGATVAIDEPAAGGCQAADEPRQRTGGTVAGTAQRRGTGDVEGHCAAGIALVGVGQRGGGRGVGQCRRRQRQVARRNDRATGQGCLARCGQRQIAPRGEAGIARGQVTGASRTGSDGKVARGGDTGTQFEIARGGDRQVVCHRGRIAQQPHADPGLGRDQADAVGVDSADRGRIDGVVGRRANAGQCGGGSCLVVPAVGTADDIEHLPVSRPAQRDLAAQQRSIICGLGIEPCSG